MIEQWYCEAKISGSGTTINYAIPFNNVYYSVQVTRKGDDLQDDTGYARKLTTGLTINPKNEHTAEIRVAGY